MEPNITLNIVARDADDLRRQIEKLIGQPAFVIERGSLPERAVVWPTPSAKRSGLADPAEAPSAISPEPAAAEPAEAPEAADDDTKPVRGENAKVLADEIRSRIAQGESRADLAAQIERLPKKLRAEFEEGASAPAPAASDVPPAPEQPSVFGDDEPAAPTGRAISDSPEERAPAEEAEEPAAAASGEEAESEEVAAPVPDVEACRSALHKVSVAKGLTAARELVQSFGAVKISDVPEEKRRAFVAACEAAAQDESEAQEGAA